MDLTNKPAEGDVSPKKKLMYGVLAIAAIVLIGVILDVVSCNSDKAQQELASQEQKEDGGDSSNNIVIETRDTTSNIQIEDSSNKLSKLDDVQEIQAIFNKWAELQKFNNTKIVIKDVEGDNEKFIISFNLNKKTYSLSNTNQGYVFDCGDKNNYILPFNYSNLLSLDDESEIDKKLGKGAATACKPSITSFAASNSLKLDGAAILIDTINNPRGDNSTVAFNVSVQNKVINVIWQKASTKATVTFV